MSINKYSQRVKKANSLVCVGLDSELEKLPERFKKTKYPQFEFNKWIIEQTAEYVSSYKPNSAFYEARGDAGIRELKMTIEYLQEIYPDIFTILDAKRGDIGNTNNGYITSIFDWLGVDAVTLQPYPGKEALKPFLDRSDKVCIIWCRTSNPGAGEFQDLVIGDKPLWKIVAEHVCADWDYNNNCMLVVGATYPKEMQIIRSLAPSMTFLVPGIGAQGGDIQAVLNAGLTQNKDGLIINSSRGIIFTDNPGEQARTLRDEINHYR
jgi:orotidine-5'-phosphate decarboxylase